MAKESKIKTPEWIAEGYNSPAEYEKAKGKKLKGKEDKKQRELFYIKTCPKCKSENVRVILGQEEGKGEWECNNCKWNGTNINKKEVSEDEFLEYMDKLENGGDKL
ncbi:MAG: hypothetical protein AABX30_00325 [Nanoarchaeota archaeon]